MRRGGCCDSLSTGRGRVSRSRRHAHRGGRLSRSSRAGRAVSRGRIDAIRALNRAGIRVVMVTNQSGVARGFFAEAVVDEVHGTSRAMLAGRRRPPRRVLLLSAPSGRQGAPSTRAPATAASRGAAWSIAPSRSSASIPRRSFTVGDRWLDVALARTVGATRRAGADRLRRRRKSDAAAGRVSTADAVVEQLIEAAELDPARASADDRSSIESSTSPTC